MGGSLYASSFNTATNALGAPTLIIGVLAILAGGIFGHFDPAHAVKLKPLGDGFIALVKMMIGPIIFCTVVLGVAGASEGILGSAVIKGHATEVIDVGHFLPMAFADWFSRKEMRPSESAQSVLLVDDSAFFRNMLAPVLKAAGYRVRVAPNAQEGLSALRSGQVFDVVLTDIEMPDMNGFEFAETIRADQHLSSLPIIALSSMVSPAAIERGRQAGFHDYVAKFDRPGLIAALKEQTAEARKAA
jgi:two-component system chemotaxis sensor kinase CheA